MRGASLVSNSQGLAIDQSPDHAAYLRYAAYLMMVIDHIGLYFFPDHIIFRIIGRPGMVIWPFFISQGYDYARSRYSYIWRLLSIATIAILPFALFNPPNCVNPIFSLFLGLIAIQLYDIGRTVDAGIFGIVLSVTVLMGIGVGLRYTDIQFTLIFAYLALIIHITKQDWVLLTGAMVAAFIWLSLTTHWIQIFGIIGVALLYLPGRLSDPMPKRFHYAFYSAHLLILWVIYYYVHYAA